MNRAQEDATRTIVNALKNPAAYIEPSGTVQLIETHISWVFLTDQFAYKLKKPVELEFLNYGTIERRRKMCEAEVRLNRRLAPLSEPLQSGQTVSIITAPGAQPNPVWLNFVVSGKARSAIRHFLKNQQQTESIELGRRLLAKALASMGSSFEEISEEMTTKVLQDSNNLNFDEVLKDIGLGNRVAYVVAKRLVPEQDVVTPDDNITPLSLDNRDGVMISYAKCCYPIPGDPIVGHISSGRGMVVHRDCCRNVAEFHDDPEKCMPLSWATEIQGDFPVEIRIDIENQRGMIAMLATRITEQEANVDKIGMEEKDARFSIVHVSITVRSRIHLANIMRRIRTIKSVHKITRVGN